MSTRERLIELREQRNVALQWLQVVNVELVKFRLKAIVWRTQLGRKKNFKKQLEMQKRHDDLHRQKRYLDEELIPWLDGTIFQLLDKLKEERALLE